MREKVDSARIRGLVASLFGTAAEYWWVWMVSGVAWLIVAVVVLQFDRSSAKTVGMVAGVVFLAGAVQSFFVGRRVDGASWIWFLFSVTLAGGALTALLYPGKTFVIVSAVVGSLLALSGLFWVAKAYAMRTEDPLWLLWAVVGIVLVCLGIWLAGQFIAVKAVTITAFTGVWALVKGVKDLAKSVHLRRHLLSNR